MMFMMAMKDAVGDASYQVLENIAKYAFSSSSYQGVLLARENPQRDDLLRQAEELVHFAKVNDPTPIFGCKRALYAVKRNGDGGPRHKARREGKKPGACFQYGKEGHYKRDCPSKEQRIFTLAVADGMDSTSHWFSTVGRVVT